MSETSIPLGTAPISKPRLSLEAISKMWLLILATIYGSGFLVVSIYHASLGLNEINPLQPRIAAAGVLLCGFIAGAGFIRIWAFSKVRYLAEGLSEWETYFFKLSFGSLYLFLNDLFSAFVLQLIFRFQGRQVLARSFPITALSLWLILGAIIAYPKQEVTKRLLTHKISMVLWGLLSLLLLGSSIPIHSQFGVRQFALYLFLLQIIQVEKLFSDQETRQGQNWVSLVSQLVLPLLAFGAFIYPHVRHAFGGGEPISASMVTMNRNGPSLPVEQLRGVRIMDETDTGFYIMQNNGQSVRYIPRSAVYSIEFSKPDDIL